MPGALIAGDSSVSTPKRRNLPPKLPVRCLQGSGWEKEVRVGVKALWEVTESPCPAGQWPRREGCVSPWAECCLWTLAVCGGPGAAGGGWWPGGQAEAGLCDPLCISSLRAAPSVLRRYRSGLPLFPFDWGGSVGRPLGAAICGVSVRFPSERLVGGGVLPGAGLGAEAPGWLRCSPCLRESQNFTGTSSR